MPAKSTVERAKEDLREGKSPTTAAGEFVHEEIEHVRRGKHGARSPQQAIAIGLSKARRAGIPLKPPAKGKTKESTRKRAARERERASGKGKEAATQVFPSSRSSSQTRTAKHSIPQGAFAAGAAGSTAAQNARADYYEACSVGWFSVLRAAPNLFTIITEVE